MRELQVLILTYSNSSSSSLHLLKRSQKLQNDISRLRWESFDLLYKGDNLLVIHHDSSFLMGCCRQ